MDVSRQKKIHTALAYKNLVSIYFISLLFDSKIVF